MQTQPRHAHDKSASKAKGERAGAKHGPPSPYEGFGPMPIAGAWRTGRMGKLLTDRDPYTGEVLAEIPLANVKDVDDAYRSAKRMQRQWASAMPQERREVLAQAAKVLARRKDEIVDWLVREAGSTLIKANLEFELARQSMLEASSYPLHVEGRILPAGVPGKESRIYRQPVGVVGVISPWNFPLQLSMRSVAPALALGNAVVLKPASETPVSGGLLIAKIYEEAGLPAGVLSVIVGAGSEVGDAIVEHPVPRTISFTGSTAVGRRIGEKAGRAVKRVCLELGGNGPLVILDDADLDRAVDAAIAGKFLHQGQICMAINRLVVDATQYDAFLDRFIERVIALKVGDPAMEGTVIGPLINQTQLDHAQKLVTDTIAAGARLLVRGQTKGLVMPPVVLADVTNDMPAAREEIFGPVAPVIRVEDEDEALRVANDTEYGLSAAVFTRDVERGVRFAERLEAGMVHVNDSPVNDEPNTAFGGEKASGLGRFGGEWAIAEFTTDRWISVQHEPRNYWF